MNNLLNGFLIIVLLGLWLLYLTAFIKKVPVFGKSRVGNLLILIAQTTFTISSILSLVGIGIEYFSLENTLNLLSLVLAVIAVIIFVREKIK